MILTQQSAYDAYAVTASDTVNLPNGICKAIYIGDAAAANVSVITQGGQTITFNNLLPGRIHEIACRRVLATNTTATDIIALY